MPAIHKLTARKVESNKVPGRLSDGAGLYLVTSKTNAKKWVYMWVTDGRRREMGLGGFPGVGLASARNKAQFSRQLVAEGKDPIEERLREEGELQKTSRSFGVVADHLVENLKADWSSEKHRQQWKRTVSHYCKPIRSIAVDQIDTKDVLRVLKPIWTTKEETARRLRSRIERILDYATAHGWRQGENPARWKGHLKDILPKRDSSKKSNFASMPYEKISHFMKALIQQVGSAALALEFTIHTAARSNEALGALWDEINFDERTWTIPANRMKSKVEHIVPLSDEVLAILKRALEMKDSKYIFPGGKKGRPLSNMSMNMLMRRMGIEGVTVHGFRSSFRDWCGDTTEFPREVAEAALSHKIGNRVEQAYRRRNALEKRRKLMTDWSKYCAH